MLLRYHPLWKLGAPISLAYVTERGDLCWRAPIRLDIGVSKMCGGRARRFAMRRGEAIVSNLRINQRECGLSVTDFARM